MYATGNKKMLNMLILEILKEYSDENHRLTQQEILRLLKKNYDMDCDRRSVKANVLSLKELGYDISMEDGYYLAERDFDDDELRMLIDSVLFSRNMTTKQAGRLIKKLVAQGNRYFSPKVKHIRSLPDLPHADNKQMPYVLDAINDAIDNKKKLAFMYYAYGTDLKLHPTREKPFVVSPYIVVASGGFYYLMANYDKYDTMGYFRVDKIYDVIAVEGKPRDIRTVTGFENGMNLPKHMAEHIYMYSGDSADITFTATKNILNSIVDWFGKDFRIIKDHDDMLTIEVCCNKKAFMYWALQFGRFVEVLKPADLRADVAEVVKGMAKKYKD